MSAKSYDGPFVCGLLVGACIAGMSACDPADNEAASVGLGGPSISAGGSAGAGSASAPGAAPGVTAGVAAAGGVPGFGVTAVDGGAGPAAPPAAPDASAGDSTWCQAKAVFDRNCVVCHDGKGSFASPMGLTTYEDFQSAAPISTGKKVVEAVQARIHDAARPMPPKGVLPAAELALLDAWIAAGARAGTCAGAAAADAGNAGAVPLDGPWPPPEGCDAIYKITSHGPGGVGSPFMVQPREETHPQVTWDAPWGTKRVQAIAFRPITDNKKVLHHWILYANNGVGAFLTGWAPGDDERQPLPKDVGMEMPTGPGSLRLDMHYNSLSATAVEPDQSGVEVCVVEGEHLRKNPAAVTMSLAVIGFPLAPANTREYEATSVCNVTTTQPVHLMTASPHAHTYAVRTRFTVKKKDGREIVMLDHPFVFGEQGSYRLDPEVVVETGDTITTTCVYTNMTSKDIGFGPNTADEMCFNFASYYPSGALSCGLGGLLGGGGLFGGLFGP